jgi:uncharacterized protein YceH (UPF0502 family)
LEYTFNETEVRVLGVLIEKEITTPDYYPLSLNALMAGCNQTSNRDPVMNLDEAAVAEAAESLREKQFAHVVNRDGSRVLKYRHVLYEALNLGRPAIAVLCVLLLRGAQTIGEIRTRTNRLYDFTSLEDVELTLKSMMAGDRPLVVRMARQPGQKEVRFAHLLSGEPVTAPVAMAEAPRAADDQLERISRLEQEVDELKKQFAEFRRQFE